MKKITPIFISDLIAKASLFSAIFLIPVYWRQASFEFTA